MQTAATLLADLIVGDNEVPLVPVGGFNDRIRRTVAGVFHPISPPRADLYFNEIGFRWSQRAITGQVMRRTEQGGIQVRRAVAVFG
jgi:hypothetical protein